MTIIRQLLRLKRSVPLTTLPQGSTLSIRCSGGKLILNGQKNKNVVVRIQSGWRDDGHAVLEQSFGKRSDNTAGSVADLTITQEEDLVTSLGRSAAHLSLLLEPTAKAASSLEALLSSTSPSQIERDGVYNFQDGDAQMVASFAMHEREGNDDNQSTCEVTVQVPEKINLICELDQGGSIHVEGKIEGDVKLKTTQGGDIRVTKLRGHTLDLSASSSGEKEALIYASDLLEAENLRITMAGGRFRAKRIHGAAVDIKMTAGEQQSTSHRESATLLEGDDDEGSLVDISSMYVSGTGGAHVSLEGNLKPTKRAVRIKSHHGPAVVNVSGVAKPTTMEEEQSIVNSNEKKVKTSSTSSYPLVDLGSVNGSCEVFIRDVSNSSNEIDNWTACHAHYDSISPDSVSLLSSDCGNIGLTFDRKMEADLRLLSARDHGSASLEEISAMLADEEDPREVVATLLNKTAASAKPQENPPSSRISILTESFTKSQACVSSDNSIEYIEGWVENKSQEPDSRFEMKTSGNKSVGKIRMEGAANQALHHFSSPSENITNDRDGDSGEPADPVRALIVAATTGKINVETLSWLGAIARRYGLDEKGRDLGRQASRRGRKIIPADE